MSDAKTIARALGGAKSGGGYLCRCPVPSHGKGRGDRSPSLLISDGERALRVHCFSGCDPLDILAELRRRGQIDDRGNSEHRTQRRRAPKPEKIEPDTGALALWRGRESMLGSLGHRYLQAREITIDPPPSLGFLPAYEHMAGRIYLPAIVAALQAGDRRVIAVQITMIDPRGDRKARVFMPRRTFGSMGDGAVRLGAAGDILGLAEGVETGISAMQIFGVPVWCCLGSGRMHLVAIPDTVRELHVFADNDAAGRAAVKKVVDAHYRKRIVVHQPVQPFNDWNDALVALAKKERAA
jgi:putative DNA primase/helicase